MSKHRKTSRRRFLVEVHTKKSDVLASDIYAALSVKGMDVSVTLIPSEYKLVADGVVY